MSLLQWMDPQDPNLGVSLHECTYLCHTSLKEANLWAGTMLQGVNALKTYYSTSY